MIFNELEVEVMRLLLEATPDNIKLYADKLITLETLQILQKQWEQASLAEREWTGCGFFTDFQLPKDAEPTIPDKFLLDGIQAEVQGFQHPVEFILFIENGRLACLEGYSCEEPDIFWRETSQVSKVRRITLTPRADSV